MKRLTVIDKHSKKEGRGGGGEEEGIRRKGGKSNRMTRK